MLWHEVTKKCIIAVASFSTPSLLPKPFRIVFCFSFANASVLGINYPIIMRI